MSDDEPFEEDVDEGTDEIGGVEGADPDVGRQDETDAEAGDPYDVEGGGAGVGRQDETDAEPEEDYEVRDVAAGRGAGSDESSGLGQSILGGETQLKPVEEQTIVITGASSGIGLTTARMAAERGANVVVAARSEDALYDLVDEIEAEGGDATVVVADVRDRDDVQEIAETARETYGGFDTWVNCAAAFMYGTIEETPVEDMRDQFDTNVWGLLYGCLEAVDELREEGGAIVNLGSVTSERAFPLQGSYSASKHAVKGFTEALRAELEHENVPISVTLIEPAAIDTPYPEHAKNHMDKEAELPPPVYAPEEVARAILHAAEHPEREIVVGGAGRALLGLDRVATRLVDWLMETVYWGEQRSDRIATGRERDVMEEPVGDLEARGDYEGHVAERSLYTRLRTNRPVLGAVVAGGLGAAVAYLRYRARQRDQGIEIPLAPPEETGGSRVSEMLAATGSTTEESALTGTAVGKLLARVAARGATSRGGSRVSELVGGVRSSGSKSRLGDSRVGELVGSVQSSGSESRLGDTRVGELVAGVGSSGSESRLPGRRRRPLFDEPTTRERLRQWTEESGSTVGRVARTVTGVTSAFR